MAILFAQANVSLFESSVERLGASASKTKAHSTESSAGAVKASSQDPDFDDSIGSGDNLKCYSITGTVPGPKHVVRLVDPIKGGSLPTDGENGHRVRVQVFLHTSRRL
jgi:hypothetical protein